MPIPPRNSPASFGSANLLFDASSGSYTPLGSLLPMVRARSQLSLCVFQGAGTCGTPVGRSGDETESAMSFNSSLAFDVLGGTSWLVEKTFDDCLSSRPSFPR